MTDEELGLLVELHKEGMRQGPGGADETRLALRLSGLSEKKDLKIADIGCGTGSSTRVLAEDLDAFILAVDFLPEFLEKLDASAEKAGLSERIRTACHSMDDLPFVEESLDAIWSEGAIYNMGFENGVKGWRPLLKPGGILAVSEITWFTDQRPQDLDDYWQAAYPEIDTAAAKMAVLERNGYTLLGYFVLPEHCWLENYYRPLQNRHNSFLQAQGNSVAAQALIAADKQEIDLYERYKAYYGYGFYIAEKA